MNYVVKGKGKKSRVEQSRRIVTNGMWTGDTWREAVAVGSRAYCNRWVRDHS